MSLTINAGMDVLLSLFLLWIGCSFGGTNRDYAGLKRFVAFFLLIGWIYVGMAMWMDIHNMNAEHEVTTGEGC